MIKTLFLTVLIGIIFLFGIKNTRAQDPPTILSSYINDSSFVLSDSYPGGTISTLNAGSVKNLYLTGVAEDTDGYSDITNVKGVFYRSGVSGGYNCSADKNSCYIIESCDTQVIIENQNQITYSCQIPMYYFADSTVPSGRYPNDNWMIYILAEDSLGSATINSTNKEIDALLSLHMPEDIIFGTMDFGQATTAVTAKKISVLQNGNTLASAAVSASGNLNCSVRGSIPLSNFKWAITQVNWNQATSVTTNPTNTNISVGYQDDDSTPPGDDLYWHLAIPEGSLEGTCVNLTTITAVAL